MSTKERAVGKRAAPRGSIGSRGRILSTFRKVVAVPADAPLWVMLQLKSDRVPALLDTGAHFSCVRSDVAEILYLTGEPCVFGLCPVDCVLADSTRCEVNNVVRLHVKLLGFSWDHEFKVLNGGPFPFILGLNFMRRTTMLVDVAAKRFSFGFAPYLKGEFGNPSEEAGGDPYLQSLVAQVSEVIGSQACSSDGLGAESFVAEFRCLFSSTLGTANCGPYDIGLLDSTPVRSSPYRCALPKMAIFRQMTNKRLEQRVVCPSKSTYASPAFLVLKREGAFAWW